MRRALRCAGKIVLESSITNIFNPETILMNVAGNNPYERSSITSNTWCS